MKSRMIGIALMAAALGAANAGQGDFRLVVNDQPAEMREDSALIGYALVHENARRIRAVGSVGRAYSLSAGRDNILWGQVAEVINFPSAAGNLVGIETAAVNMAHDNHGEVHGLDVVFKNRMDVSLHQPVPVVGRNRFNEDSAGIVLSSQPRSPAGEFSGWQAGIRFAGHSLDRSSTGAYAAAIDASELDLAVPFYLLVWRCGSVKCGLAPTREGITVVYDIEPGKPR